MIRIDLWHGGAPGRQPGDLLLSPDVTGLQRTSAVLSVEAGLAAIAHRRDRVYIAGRRDLARVWAGQWENEAGAIGYGWLYRVSVDEALLEPDDDLVSLPGLSFQVPEARVDAIYEKAVAPNQSTFRRTLRRALDELEDAKRRHTL